MTTKISEKSGVQAGAGIELPPTQALPDHDLQIITIGGGGGGGGGVALPKNAMERMAKSKHVDTFKPGELMIPWFQIVQTSSGFMKKNNAAYIKDAAEGDLIDTVSHRLRSTQEIILLKFETHYTTWKPKGGPLVKQWFADPTGYNAASFPEGRNYGAKIDGDNNEVRPSPMYYILMVDRTTGRADPATMSFASTQSKKTRRINTLAREDLPGPDGMPYTPPLYARTFDVKTVIENGKGDQADKSWGGWQVEVGDLVLSVPKYGEMWYAKAEAFRDQIELGNVRPHPPTDAERELDEDRAERTPWREGPKGAGSGAPQLDDDLPF